MSDETDKAAGGEVELAAPELPPMPIGYEAAAPVRAAAKTQRGARWSEAALRLAYAHARGCTREAAARYAAVSHKTAWQYAQDPDWPALVLHAQAAIQREIDEAWIKEEANLQRRGVHVMLRSLIDLMEGNLPGGKVANNTKKPAVSPMVSVIAAKSFGELVGYQRAKEMLAEMEADRQRQLEGLAPKGKAGDIDVKKKANRVIVDATLES